MTGYERNFIGDFNHVSEMYKELNEIMDNWEDAEIKPNCPKDLLEAELDALYNLLNILKTRADTEGIKL